MAYSAVYVIGDSLVDSGNALELAEFVDDIPFSALPDGAPTSALGYYDGRFTNGFNFADLISNKFVSVPTKPVFPFGFNDPYLGISFPFASDPQGNNLNFAYGGARIRKGSESVPDLDDQTDALIDAIDGDADSNALQLVTIGGNDVRSLVPISGSIASLATAQSRLANAAQEFHEEMDDLIDAGLRHFVVTGIPNVGMIPGYDDLPDEDARRTAARDYSAMLDGMIYQYVLQLRAANPGVTILYVSLVSAATSVIDRLDQIFTPDQLAQFDNPSDILFFDHVHPTAQAHALIASYILDTMNGSAAGETLALASPDYHLAGTIGAAGEVDRITISLAANASYTFELLGISSGKGSLADPSIRLLGPGGSLVATNDDGGLGLDAVVNFTAAQAGDYVLELAGVGSLSGSYRFQASGDTAGDNSYIVANASALLLELPGEGFDTALASVSYVLPAGASIEKLATASPAGKTSINLTGNELDQAIYGNAGNNILDGKGGSDWLWGGAGKDMFALTSNGAIDVIDDFNVRDDTIYLDDAVFTGMAPGTLNRAAFVTGVAATGSSDRIIFDQASGNLYFDPDGTGPSAQAQFASLDAGLKITASDFIII